LLTKEHLANGRCLFSFQVQIFVPTEERQKTKKTFSEKKIFTQSFPCLSSDPEFKNFTAVTLTVVQ
jgi:hypothetical protein